MTELNERQRRFCDEYLIDLNATQAAIRAGYSKKTAGSQGFDLLKKPEIQAYLSVSFKKTADATGITKERVLKELGRLAFADIRAFYNTDGGLKPISELDDEAAAILSGVESYEEQASENPEDESVVIGVTKKIKLYDKTKSLEMLAKYFGMFERDNEQKKQEVVAPMTDDQVDKVISALRKRK